MQAPINEEILYAELMYECSKVDTLTAIRAVIKVLPDLHAKYAKELEEINVELQKAIQRKENSKEYSD